MPNGTCYGKEAPMTIEEMKQKKEEYGYTCDWIARQTGIPVSTVRKIFSGETKKPRRETMIQLSKLFSRSLTYDYASRPEPVFVSEAAHAYGALEQDRLFTLDDYYRMPDQPRVELIDGHIYLMAAPNVMHQRISYVLQSSLNNYIEKKGKSCFAFAAPTDVQPDAEDDTTIVQPDVFVICDEKKMENPQRIIAAPELVIEILSPSNRNHDLVRKRKKYEKVGVKEYWMVDPEGLTVTTILYENESLIHMYSFKDPVPVELTGGELTIDLSQFYHEG